MSELAHAILALIVLALAESKLHDQASAPPVSFDPLLMAAIALAPVLASASFAMLRRRAARAVEREAHALEYSPQVSSQMIRQALTLRRDFDALNASSAGRMERRISLLAVLSFALLCCSPMLALLTSGEDAAPPASLLDWLHSGLGVPFALAPVLAVLVYAAIQLVSRAFVVSGLHARYDLRVGLIKSALHSLPSASARLNSQWMVLVPIMLLSLLVSLAVWAVPELAFAAHAFPSFRALLMPLMIAALMALSPLLVKLMLPLKPVEQGSSLHDALRNVESRCGLAADSMLIWQPKRFPLATAFLIGLIRPLRYVIFTHALTRKLSQEELCAAYAHELGHAKHRHLLQVLVFLASFMLLQGAAVYWLTPLLIASFGESFAAWHISTPMIELAILGVLFAAYFYPLFGAFSRRVERQADAFAIQHTSAEAISSALHRLGGAGAGKKYFKPGWRHFSIAQRIREIQVMASESLAHSATLRRFERERRALVLVMLLVGSASLIALIPAIQHDLRYGPPTFAMARADELRTSSPDPEAAKEHYRYVLTLSDNNARHVLRSPDDFSLGLQGAAAELHLSGTTQRFTELAEFVRQSSIDPELKRRLLEQTQEYLAALEEAAEKD